MHCWIISAKGLFFLLLTGLLAACASTIQPPQWVFERDAIRLEIQADPQLNIKNGVAHTLLLCVYQLQEPTAFERLAADPAGLHELLECGLFDPSATTSKRLFIHPGEATEVMLDRASGTRHLAVVAGYYTIERERIARLLDVPVVVEKKGLLGGSKRQKAGRLAVELYLGPKQILSAEGK
jgi:type VI secretion system VasD/TssJ family lipoprotein